MTQIFIEFVMMQAQNAALFLGQIPNPRGGEPEAGEPDEEERRGIPAGIPLGAAAELLRIANCIPVCVVAS